jgi:ribosome-associated translation inhibitor RaiA
MYAAIDLLADKLDRQVLRYKEQHQSGGHPSRVAAKGLDQV